MNADQFFSKLKPLDDECILDEALDIIYEQFGKLGAKKDFEMMGEILKNPNMETLSIDCAIGILTASRSYRKQIPIRLKAIKDFEKSLLDNNINPKEILSGLDPENGY